MLISPKAILAAAAAELGTKESPPHSNNVKYNTAYYNRPVSGGAYPWCCAFIWWLFQQLGGAELFYGGGKTASCTNLYHFYQKQGQTVPVEQAQPGDLIFFRFSAGSSVVMEHIGICESCGGGYITTIDGNSGTDNEANGGAVMRRKRAIQYAAGAARPKYQNEEEIDMTKEELQAMVDAAVEKALAERDATQAAAAQKVSPWAAEAWDRSVKSGLFDGTRPGGVLTREQAAVVLERAGID